MGLLEVYSKLFEILEARDDNYTFFGFFFFLSKWVLHSTLRSSSFILA